MNTTWTGRLTRQIYRFLILMLLAGLAFGVTARSVAASDVVNYTADPNATQVTIEDSPPHSDAQDRITSNLGSPVLLSGVEIVNVTSGAGSQTATLNPLDLGTPIELITIDTGTGDDTFNITPSSSAAVFLDGGAHVNGDTLIVDAQGAAAVDTGTAVQVSGFQDITYTNIETVTILNAAKGTIIIEKQTEPGGATGTFDFTYTITSPLGFSLSHDQTRPFADVTPGTYTFTETKPGPAFDLTDITCTDDNSPGNETTGVATINLEASETVTCTFTNTERGDITIVKEVVPDDSSLWDFALDGPTAGTKADLTDGQSHTFSDLVPGFYNLTETSQAGYATTIDCGSEGSDDDDDIFLSLNPGEAITCTFTNTVHATLVIQKQTDAGGCSGTFTFEVPDLAPGSYSVTEDDPAPRFDLTAIRCDDGGSATPSTGDVGAGTATFQLDPGETVECAFTNTYVPPVVIGGMVVPVDRLELLASWQGLAALAWLASVVVALVRRRRSD